MDERGLELVRDLIQGHIDNAIIGAPTQHTGRGSTLVELHNALIEQARAEVAKVDIDLAGAPDETTRLYAGRQLTRTLTNVETILPFLRPLIDSLRRTDVPIGLLVALDAVVDQLLPHGADPVVQFDDAHMYSTLDLYEALGWSATAEPTPVAFFVPILDPYNALLAPLLAHEIGHTAIQQASLGSEAMARASDGLNELLAGYLEDLPDEDRLIVQTQLVKWVDELICDVLATLICGPSYLFAAATFLPATSAGDVTGSHPFPSERIKLILDLLDALDWTPVLDAACPNTIDWLRATCTAPAATANPQRSSFLRQACAVLGPVINDVAAEHVSALGDVFAAADFLDAEGPAMDQFRMRIPPSELDSEPLDPWTIVLLGWVRQFEIHGDSPRTLARAASDREISPVILRAIEMAKVRHLWSTTDAV